ncbi:hypothetical protein CHUAL_005031 [Chamberlinius hualienensis]
MVVGAFPLAKLATIAFKQLSKPLATRIKNGAKDSVLFREYICMPPAQIYHWVEVTVKMRMMNLGKPTDVPKLNEAMAIELGAELLGEGIIFLVAAACLVAEYRRSSNKEREKEERRENQIIEMNQRIEELELRLERQSTRIRGLDRMTSGMHTSFTKWWSKSDQEKSDDTVNKPQEEEEVEPPPVNKGLIFRAIADLEPILIKSGHDLPR